MPLNTAEKITLLNKVTFESLSYQDKVQIVQLFTEASLKILEADFGFAWWRPSSTDEFQLIYTSEDMPYDPPAPRKRGGNYLAQKEGRPVFVEDVTKEKYTPETDVSPYMKSYVIIPIISEKNSYGTIVLCYTKRKRFTKQDKGFCDALGNSLAQALTITRLYRDLADFKNTLDNTLDSIFIFNPNSLEMEYVNQGAVLFTGRKQAELLQQPLHEIITGLDESALRAKIAEILQNPESDYVTFEDFAQQGADKVPVEISLQNVTQKDQAARFLAIVRNISERKHNENVIKKMAYFDPLTGLPNRALLTARLTESHEQAETQKAMYALFFIDLDRFKVVNDIYGHHIGDLLLMQVAKRMQKALPKKATLARMGGDEFMVLLPNLQTVDEAKACATEIIEIFRDSFILNDQEVYSNGSIGYALFPFDGVDPSTLLKHADLALHRAKDRGGGNIQQYRIGQPLYYSLQPKLESQLRQAVKRGELSLQYQPIINVKTKRISGAEALVRWIHPEMGKLYPGAFINQAEESGIIVEIGKWVIAEVCRQIQQWEEQGRIPPPININISPRELLRPSLVNHLEQSLKEFHVAPSQLKVELTETFLMKDIDLSLSILEQLKSLGLRILIDDFGTGYASLNYLKRLPIDAVKIDKTFIQGLPLHLQDAALTSAIIAISHQLGLDVVAEGVETQSQYEFLRAAQCNYAQGNLFYKPFSAREFGKLLRQTFPSKKLA
jgi:diguanylate cyclase